MSRLVRQLVRAVLAEDIQPAEQQRNWTCGPASLKAVVRVLKGPDIPEDELIDVTNANHSRGTSPANLVAGCKKLNLNARHERRLSNDDLRSHIRSGCPVILDVDMWDGEHWVVIHRCSEHGFTMMDPALGDNEDVTDSILDAMRWDSDSGETRGGVVVMGPWDEDS